MDLFGKGTLLAFFQNIRKSLKIFNVILQAAIRASHETSFMSSKRRRLILGDSKKFFYILCHS